MPRKTAIAALMSAMLVLGSGCAVLQKAVQKPTIAFQTVSVRSVSSETASVDVHFNVQNPNLFDIPLKKYAYALNIGESRLLSGDQALSLSIPAKGSGALSVPLTIRFSEVMGALNALTNSDAIPYSVAGTVTIDAGPLAGLTIPFEHAASIPRPALPSVSVDRVAVTSMSLTGVDANLVLSVRNPGKLAYALDSFAGNLELNGRNLATIDGITGTQRLAAGASQTVTIPLRLSSTQALMGIQSLLSSGTVSYRIRGTAGLSADLLGSMPLSLDQSGTTRVSR